MDKFKRAQDWVIAVLGLYASLSPLFYTYSGGAGFSVVVAIAILICAVIALAMPNSKAVQWIIIVASALLFFTPLISGVAGWPAWNLYIVSIVMIILSAKTIKSIS
ncbi:MAG: SPW repeat domain-containing protein [Sphaerochaetaceae bacterium]